MNSQSDILTRARIIFLALFIGQLLFLIVATIVSMPLKPEVTPDIETVVFGLLGLVIPWVMTLVFRVQKRNAMSLPTAEERVKAFLGTQIILYAGIEAPTLFLIVSVLLKQQLLFVGLAAFNLLIFLLQFPTQRRFDQFVGRGDEYAR